MGRLSGCDFAVLEETTRFSAEFGTFHVLIAGTSGGIIQRFDYFPRSGPPSENRIGNAIPRGLSTGIRSVHPLQRLLLSDQVRSSTRGRGLYLSTALEFTTAPHVTANTRSAATARDSGTRANSWMRSIWPISAHQISHTICLRFELANRQNTLKFLAAAADPNAGNVREEFENRASRAAGDFVRMFLGSDIVCRR